MMDFRFRIMLPLMLTLLSVLSRLTTGLPINANDGNTAHVPYDVKYIPVKISDELLDVEPLNYKNSDSRESIGLNKHSAMLPLNLNAEPELVKIAEPKEDLIALSLTAHDRLRRSLVVVEHNGEENDEYRSSKSYRHKRQSPGFPFYRPVFRFSRVSSSRRRLYGPSRNPAMVGYLSDRDYFPTVA